MMTQEILGHAFAQQDLEHTFDADCGWDLENFKKGSGVRNGTTLIPM